MKRKFPLRSGYGFAGLLFAAAGAVSAFSGSKDWGMAPVYIALCAVFLGLAAVSKPKQDPEEGPREDP